MTTSSQVQGQPLISSDDSADTSVDINGTIGSHPTLSQSSSFPSSSSKAETESQASDKSSTLPPLSSLPREEEQPHIDLSEVEGPLAPSSSRLDGPIVENGISRERGVHFDSTREESASSEPEKQKQDGGGANSSTQEVADGTKRKFPETLDGEEHVVNASPTRQFVRYEHEIGRGSFKTVYKGLDTETGVAVAWCELLEHKFNKEEQSRFKEEVSILKTLNHPYILRLYDSFEFVRNSDKKRVLVLITELMTSGTLKSYMRRFKSIKPRVIRSWGRQILRGLSFLHTRTPPIIHRDLKCDNIFINGTTGLVKIGDLGLATLKRSDVKTVIGTPEFMAPEMYDEVYDESVDMYAFGMCLLEMCTLEYPYQECSNPAQIYKKVTTGVMPHSLAKVNDPILKEVIIGCTKLSKSERYSVEKLLHHEFFAEGDVKVEVMTEPAPADSNMMFRLMVPRTSKENQKNGQESIEFAYNLQTDVPEDVVNDMVKSGILREEDKKNAIRSVRELTDPLTDPAKQKRQQKPSAVAHGNAAGNGTVAKETGEGSHLQMTATEMTPLPQEIDLSSNKSSFQRQLSSASDDADPSSLPSSSAPKERSTVPTTSSTGGGGGSETPSANNSPNIPHKITSGAAIVVPPESLEDTETKEPNEDDKKLPEVPPTSSTTKTTPPLPKAAPKGKVMDEERGSDQSLNTKQPQQDGGNRLSFEETHQIDSTSGNANNNLITSNNSEAPPTGTKAASVHYSVSHQPETLTTGTYSQAVSGGVASIAAQTQSLPAVSSTLSQSVSGGTSITHSSQSSSSSSNPSSTSSGYHTLSSSSHVPLSLPPSSSSTPPTLESEQQSGSSNGSSSGSTSRTSKKGSRNKDNKRIRLKFNEKVKDNVISCTLTTSAGQVINFKFSLEYDKPNEIFHNLVKHGHLSQIEEGDFITQIKKVVDTVRKSMTEGETTSSDPKKTPPLRSSSSSSSALVKQEPEFSKQSETSQKGVPRSDSPYEAGTVFLPIASKREGQPVMEASPLSRRKFDVSDVIVEGVNEKPSVTSQLSAESMTAMSPVHSDDTCSLPPPSFTSTDSTTKSIEVFQTQPLLPTCPLTGGNAPKGGGGSDPLSVTLGNQINVQLSSTASSAISSASSSYSNLQPSGTVTPNIVTIEASNKKFEIEDVIDPPEPLTSESSSENLLEEKAESKQEALPSESTLRDEDGVSTTSNDFPTLPTFNEEDTLTQSRVKDMDISQSTLKLYPQPHPPSTASQSMYTMEPVFVPPTHPMPTFRATPSDPLVLGGFIKFLHYMKLLFKDPSVAALLERIDDTGQPQSSQYDATLPTSGSLSASSGHTMTSNGSSGGHTNVANGHSGSVYSAPAVLAPPTHSSGLMSSLYGHMSLLGGALSVGMATPPTGNYSSLNEQVQQSDDETDSEREHYEELLSKINKIEEEEKRLKKEKERMHVYLNRRGSGMTASNFDSSGHMTKAPAPTYPPHYATPTSSTNLSSASHTLKDEREQQQQNLQTVQYQQQQQLNYYGTGHLSSYTPHPSYHYYKTTPPVHHAPPPSSHDAREGGPHLSQHQKNTSSSNLAAAAGDAPRHIDTGRGAAYYPMAPHVLSHEAPPVIPQGMWLPPYVVHGGSAPPPPVPHYSSTGQTLIPPPGLHHTLQPHISHPPPSSHPPPPMQQGYQSQQGMEDSRMATTSMTSPTCLESGGGGEQDLSGALQKR